MKQLLFVLSFISLFLVSEAQMTPYTPPVKKTARDRARAQAAPGKREARGTTMLPKTGEAHDSREGTYGGISLGYFHYSTHWYYHDGSGGSSYYDNYAAHNLNRAVISLSLQKKAVRQMEHFDFDLGGELLLGPFGNAKATYLPGDNVISSGGWAAGLNFYGRAVYKPSGTDNRIYPFAGIGPHYMFLHNNGKTVGTAATEYGYSDGWNEGVLLVGLSLGVEMQMQSYTLTPELRLGLFGWNSSSWTPHGRDVSMNGGPGFIAFSLHLSKKL